MVMRTLYGYAIGKKNNSVSCNGAGKLNFGKKGCTCPLCLPAPKPLLESLMLCLDRTYASQSGSKLESVQRDHES